MVETKQSSTIKDTSFNTIIKSLTFDDIWNIFSIIRCDLASLLGLKVGQDQNNKRYLFIVVRCRSILPVSISHWD